MRSRIGILGLAAVVGLSLVGPQPWGRSSFADGEDVAAEQPDLPEPTADAGDIATPSAADTPPDSVFDSAAVETAKPPADANSISDETISEPTVTAETPALPAPDATSHGPDPMLAGRRVRVRLDAAGELFSNAGGDGATVREPVAMNARFDFDERPAAADGAASREYRDATAALDLAGRKTSTSLAADARRLLVARRGTTPSSYLETGFLTGDEADLLETPFDSLLVDDLLPTAAVRLEERWDVAADLAAGLLAIDTVESGGLTARIVEVTEGRAKVVLEGIVDGAVDGVPTHVTLEGSCTAAVETVSRDDAAGDAAPGETHVFRGLVSQVAVVVRERRQPSHVAPGFDVEARLVVARGPLDSGSVAPEAAADGARGAKEPAATTLRPRGAGEPGRLWHRDPAGRFDLVHDSGWKRVEDGPHGLVLRLVDHGALVGQCSIMCLPGAPAAEPPGVADVRRDFERSLAGQVSRIETAEETVREDGLRVVRLEAAGTAGGLSFRWMHYVLAGPGGRAGVTFMCEEPLRQRFGAADRRLVEGLRVLAGVEGGDPEAATAARPAGGVGPRR
jgi:hypothetical protein